MLIIVFLITPSFQLSAHTDLKEDQGDINIIDKTGLFIPLDLKFTDEYGRDISLKDIFQRPVILSPVYLSCPNICNFILEDVARLVDKLDAEPGKDYSIITFSFDENDKPENAMEKKRGFQRIIKKKIPDASWKFLTGDRESIKKLADSIGFSFKKRGNEFIHPVLLIVLSSDGRIVRYILGKGFLPFDIKMALVEASEGRVGSITNRALLLCYTYDPEGRRYVLNITRIGGIIIILSLTGLSVFLLRNRSQK